MKLESYTLRNIESKVKEMDLLYGNPYGEVDLKEQQMIYE